MDTVYKAVTNTKKFDKVTGMISIFNQCIEMKDFNAALAELIKKEDESKAKKGKEEEEEEEKVEKKKVKKETKEPKETKEKKKGKGCKK